MQSPEERQAIAAQLDERYLIDTMVELAQGPTDVPLGPDVFMAPDDPKLVHYVRHTLGDLSPYTVRVQRGAYMWLALVDPQHPGVLALMEVHRQVRGTDLEVYYGQGSFDAGGPCAAGVPAVMYGVGVGRPCWGKTLCRCPM